LSSQVMGRLCRDEIIDVGSSTFVLIDGASCLKPEDLVDGCADRRSLSLFSLHPDFSPFWFGAAKCRTRCSLSPPFLEQDVVSLLEQTGSLTSRPIFLSRAFSENSGQFSSFTARAYCRARSLSSFFISVFIACAGQRVITPTFFFSWSKRGQAENSPASSFFFSSFLSMRVYSCLSRCENGKNGSLLPFPSQSFSPDGIVR